MSRRPFRIDGVEIPVPDEYTYSIEDLSSEATGRTLDGYMHKDVVADKITCTCTWKGMSWHELAHLLSLLKARTQFQLTYPDPENEGVYRIGTFYVGTRTGKAVNLLDEVYNWTDVSMSFIEV